MDDEDKPKSFEEALREIADEVQRGIQRFQAGEFEDVARSYGIDTDRAKRFVDGAGEWLRAQTENLGDVGFPMPAPTPSPSPAKKPTWNDDPLSGAGPDPLDMPTDEQGRALAALDSGRWTIEPGTSMLAAHGEGPGPSDALGLVRELRVRDWIDADGEVTLVGGAALRRWLERN
ncbi:hypothetical protein DVA67_001640 [Solirubrobacter sp. CPCC 204708]|uniref:Uncharacterized protein n=1 Tax=Solirubrobacter deserti TaxID=2282478 RepID=A0ABT4RDR8_9ACTN|nr:hypothetical protein [Solirubrobacter deserti]MBE2314660.1 hypothetical protein [Solirubrobacter deserti]MDA0136667.1 hypothetical protein [Solirubrobacter deserti]